MRKISEIVRSQATYQFNQKKMEVIKNTLKKNCTSEKSFQDCLKIYNFA